MTGVPFSGACSLTLFNSQGAFFALGFRRSELVYCIRLSSVCQELFSKVFDFSFSPMNFALPKKKLSYYTGFRSVCQELFLEVFNFFRILFVSLPSFGKLDYSSRWFRVCQELFSKFSNFFFRPRSVS
jgi:hypothetical protein